MLKPEEASQQVGGLKLVAMVASLLLGIWVAFTSSPLVFRAAKTDIARIGFLLDVLKDSTLKPQIVFLGNSVVMDGVDARVVVQMITPRNLAKTAALDNKKYNAYCMSGFRPSADTSETLTSIFGNEVSEILGESPLAPRQDEKGDGYARSSRRD